MSDSEQSPVSRSKRAPKAEASKPSARAVIESAPGHSMVYGKPDPVVPSAVVYNPRRKKSVTIFHLQRRLEEVGYNDAAAGLAGQYDALTQRAFEAWQSDNGYEPGETDVEQLSNLFDGDPNVTVEYG